MNEPEHQRKLTRRELLFGGAAVGAVVAAGTLALTQDKGEDGQEAFPGPSSTSRPAPTAPPSSLPPLESVALIGTAYLEAYPADADVVVLREAVPEITGTTAAEQLAALPAIAARASEEFRSAATVVVDGWVLARSEGQAAALISLSP